MFGNLVQFCRYKGYMLRGCCCEATLRKQEATENQYLQSRGIFLVLTNPFAFCKTVLLH